jgi:hypothetical protein
MATISNAARLYALRELSRRAGVTNADFQRWKIDVEANELTVQPQWDAPGWIRFPFDAAETHTAEVVKKAWYREPLAELRELIPDFVVPFCRVDSIAQQPLFLEESPQRFLCTEDLLASTLLTLCRFEEVNASNLDKHGRFPASASIALRRGFLDRPIVDEYGLALEQILQAISPGRQPAPRSLRVKLSHDIDLIGIPFDLRSAVGHVMRRGSPLSSAKDFLSLVTPVEPAFLDLVRKICQLSIDRGLHSALYWKTSGVSEFDSGYDFADPRIVRVVDWARSQGIEMGVHPGYDTFRSPPHLEQEVQRCRDVLNSERIGGRQHYLRWCPETWADWERCGLAYDSTVGYADHVGFRAGTCIPYLPWLWKANRPADLLEIPLVVMDVTLAHNDYMRLDPEQSLSVVNRLMQSCAAVGGVFTLLWHNDRLMPPYGRYYSPILETLSGIPNYDWESDARKLRSEVGQLAG